MSIARSIRVGGLAAYRVMPEIRAAKYLKQAQAMNRRSQESMCTIP